MISGNDPRRHPCIPTRSDNERKCFQNYSTPSEEEKCCCAAKPGANSGLCPHLKALQMNTQTGQRLKGLRAASTGFRPWDKSQTSNSSWKCRRNPKTLKRGDLQHWMSSGTRGGTWRNLLRKTFSSWIQLNGLMGLYSMVLIFWGRAETTASFTSIHMESLMLEKTPRSIRSNLQPIYYETLGRETLRDEGELVQGNLGA